MNFVKTLPSGKTVDVSIGYQDSEGVPNLYIAFGAIDAAGSKIKPKDWDREINKEYDKVFEALEKAGFNLCTSETVMGVSSRRPISMGLEHPNYDTKGSLEREGERILTGLGFEAPMRSMVIRPVKHADRTISPESKPKPMDWVAVRDSIEDKIVATFGNSKEAQKLATDIVDDFKKKLGIAKGSPGAGLGN